MYTVWMVSLEKFCINIYFRFRFHINNEFHKDSPAFVSCSALQRLKQDTLADFQLKGSVRVWLCVFLKSLDFSCTVLHLHVRKECGPFSLCYCFPLSSQHIIASLCFMPSLRRPQCSCAVVLAYPPAPGRPGRHSESTPLHHCSDWDKICISVTEEMEGSYIDREGWNQVVSRRKINILSTCLYLSSMIGAWLLKQHENSVSLYRLIISWGSFQAEEVFHLDRTCGDRDVTVAHFVWLPRFISLKTITQCLYSAWTEHQQVLDTHDVKRMAQRWAEVMAWCPGTIPAQLSSVRQDKQQSCTETPVDTGILFEGLLHKRHWHLVLTLEAANLPTTQLWEFAPWFAYDVTHTWLFRPLTWCCCWRSAWWAGCYKSLNLQTQRHSALQDWRL